jgi:hypothetical protein
MLEGMIAILIAAFIVGFVVIAIWDEDDDDADL